LVGLALPGFAGRAATPEGDEPVRWRFSAVDHGTATKTPSTGLAFDAWLDLEEQMHGSAIGVRVDLDGDGASAMFVRTARGSGGCECPIFQGPQASGVGRCSVRRCGSGSGS
jgi:hypothetical protein